MPVPIVNGGKRPAEGFNDWQNVCAFAGERDIGAWAENYANATNTGILCDGLRAVDIDVDDADTAERLKALALDKLGVGIVRSRPGSPRLALIYRADKGDPPTLNMPGLQVLGRGAQIVIDGIHPSGSNYACELADDHTLDTLPVVTEAQIAAFRIEAAAILGIDAEAARADRGDRQTSDKGLIADDVAELAAAVELIPNDDRPDWERWNDHVAKIHAATGGSEEGREIALAWSRKSAAHDDATFDARWRHFDRSPYRQAGAGALYHEAAEHGFARRMLDDIEVDDCFDVVTELDAKPASSKFKTKSPAECADAPPRGYRVKSILAPRDLAVIFGPPGVAKTVLAAHVAYAVAQGRAVLGKRTKPGRVLYVACEDPNGMGQRVHALYRRYGDADFHLLDAMPDLLPRSPDTAELLKLVRDTKPALVVLDTIAAGFAGLKENDPEGMGHVVKVARALTKHGAAVLLVHHSTKADDGVMRGHGILNGAVDVTLGLTKDERTGIVTVAFGKNRNGPSFETFAFTVESEALGTDEDGDPITAPVAVECTAPATVAAKLPPSESAALAVLLEVTSEHGEQQSDGRITVNEAVWRERCDDSRRVSAADNAKSRNDAIKRAMRGLIQKNLLGAGGGLLWLKDAQMPMPDDPADYFDVVPEANATGEQP